MTWGWVVVGTLAQLMLGLFLFMLVVFSASSMDGVGKLAGVHSKILTLSLFGLPATCVVSAGMLIHLYRSGGGPSSWWWHAMPLAAAAVYLVYAISLGKQIEALREKEAGSRNSTGEGK
jgi:hypothetical protein